MYLVTFLTDTKAALNLIFADIPRLQPASSIQHHNVAQLRTASWLCFNAHRTTLLCIRIGDLCVRTWFGIVKNRAVNVLFGTTSVSCFVRVRLLSKIQFYGTHPSTPTLELVDRL